MLRPLNNFNFKFMLKILTTTVFVKEFISFIKRPNLMKKQMVKCNFVLITLWKINKLALAISTNAKAKIFKHGTTIACSYIYKRLEEVCFKI